MLYRKIESYIENHLRSNANKVLIINGAHQIGKSYIIRHVGKKLYPNFIEINLQQDFFGERLFENTRTVEDFYLLVSMLAGDKMKDKDTTLIFFDDIQVYPHLIALLKFLKQDDKFNYIASGTLMGEALSKTESIPIGSIEVKHMYPLDFEEFLIANGFNSNSIEGLYKKYVNLESLDEAVHARILDLFKKYLLVGGLPDAVNSYLTDKNIVNVRTVQKRIYENCMSEVVRYCETYQIKAHRIMELIPSALTNKKKRIVVQLIDGKKGSRFSDYKKEFEYLADSSLAIEVNAITSPDFPLIESNVKNLLKLYLSDVGILTNILYQLNIRAVLDNQKSVELGAVYESAVATELKAHEFKLYYYDNKVNGEVDFIINDYDELTTVPIKVKSGKNYTVFSAINHFVRAEHYKIKKAYIFSNERQITIKGKTVYLPIYFVMFLGWRR